MLLVLRTQRTEVLTQTNSPHGNYFAFTPGTATGVCRAAGFGTATGGGATTGGTTGAGATGAGAGAGFGSSFGFGGCNLL